MTKVKFDFLLKERNDLPFVYNKTKIVIMPRDPETIFMYWDIENSKIAELQQQNIQTNVSIRIRNVENYDYYFVNPTINSKDWYFNLKYTNLRKNDLIADLGVYDNNGNFLVLSTSNIITLPSNSYCQKDYDYWKKIVTKNKNFSFGFCERNENIFLSQINSMEFFVKK